MPQALPINNTPAYGEAAPPWLVSESESYLSREEVTLKAHAAELPTGLVLGKVTATGVYEPHNPGGAGGVDVAAGILYATQPAQGTAATATYGTAVLGSGGTAGKVVSVPQTAGGSNYVYGKSYTLTPTGGTPETPATIHAVGQSDGTLGPAIVDDGGAGYDTAPTVAAEAPPAVGTTKVTVIVRLAEVQYDLLKWDASADTQNERDLAMADLLVNHIVRR